MEISFNGFVPAVVDAIMGKFLNDRRFNLLCWWKRGSAFYYPSLLVSAYYGMKFSNIREKFEVGKDILIVGDSGGFQIQGKGDYLEPIQVLRWLENNVDVGITLDVPPIVGGPSKVYKDIQDFKARVKQTYRYYESMLRNRQRDNLILLKVLHGSSKVELDLFYNTTKELEFDGWALAPKPAADPMALALQFVYIYEKGAIDTTKWLHVLGISGNNTLPLSYYIKTYLPKRSGFTIDSSSWATGGKFRRLLFPFTFVSQLNVRIGRNPQGKNTDIIVSSNNYHEFNGKMPCFCPVCSSIDLETIVTDQTEEGSIWSGLFVSMHNLWSTLLYCHFLDFLSQKREYIRQWVVGNCNERTAKALEFIEYALKYGVNEAYTKFKPLFKKLEPGTQLTLW